MKKRDTPQQHIARARGRKASKETHQIRWRLKLSRLANTPGPNKALLRKLVKISNAMYEGMIQIDMQEQKALARISHNLLRQGNLKPAELNQDEIRLVEKLFKSIK